MEKVLRIYLLVNMLLLPQVARCQQSDTGDFVLHLHQQECDRTDSICATLMSALHIANDTDILMTAVVPEYKYQVNSKKYVPQDIYSFYCCKRLDDLNAKCYRIVFDYSHEVGKSTRDYLSEFGRNQAIAQVDSIVIDGQMWHQLKRDMESLAAFKPFILHNNLDFGRMIYIRLFTGDRQSRYVYSDLLEPISGAKVRCIDALIDDVRMGFGKIRVKQIERKPIDISRGVTFPFVDTEDDGFYRADYNGAYVNVFKTCKSIFKRTLDEKRQRVEDAKCISFYNRLLVAVRNKGVALDSIYDMRCIFYVHNVDAYSIITVRGDSVHRILADVRSDGSVFVKSDMKSGIVIERGKLRKDYTKRIGVMQNTIRCNTYCYSLDESKYLLELRNNGLSSVSVVGLAGCKIANRTEFDEFISFVRGVSYCLDNNDLCYPIVPIVEKMRVIPSKRVVGYSYTKGDCVLGYRVGVDGY